MAPSPQPLPLTAQNPPKTTLFEWILHHHAYHPWSLVAAPGWSDQIRQRVAHKYAQKATGI
jgi:hypothetical protein